MSTRIHRWPECLLAAGIGAALILVTPAAISAPPPNILFIAIDDLNDWVGALGGHPQVKTPHMDRLAARGTVFLNAHCQAPLCNPSRTSLLTGLRPTTTGVYGLAPWFRALPEFADAVTLPQHLAAHGYHTLCAGKIYHGGYPPGPQRAKEFHTWGPGSAIGAKPDQKLIPPTPGGNHPLMDWGTFPHRDEDKGDWQVASWGVEQLQSELKEPFFLALGFFLPHVPCYATQPWFDLYPESELKLPPILSGDRDDTPDFSWYIHWKLPEPRLSWLQSADQWGPLVRAYLASTSFVDSQVGRLLDALNAAGLEENTVVVLWSDHGYHLGEKAISGKNSLWERSTRVPLIFAGPGVARGGRCVQPVELLDLYPTLNELCGLPKKAELEGHSLVPQLRDAGAVRPWPAITSHNQGNHAVRTDRWRYIRYADGSEELYDMERDPNEWENLAGKAEHAERVAELKQWLPKVDRPPAAGSAHRVLTYDKESKRAVWEGRVIDVGEAER